MRLLTIPIVLAVCLGATATSAVDGRGQVVSLSRYGLTITLPSGWRGRIYRRRGGLPEP